MNKKNRRGRKLAVLIVAGFLFTAIIIMNKYYIRYESKQYSIGDKYVNNPDRGFYVQISSSKKDKIEKYAENVRMVLLEFDLYEYRNETIPDSKLCELEDFLKEAKEQNVKCIFRAAYGFDREESNDADSLERIGEHISQISPILNCYKEQIVCVQAGFFGPWGEWHSSRYLEKDEEAAKNRCWLLQELLGQLDKDIIIDVRRPRFIREAIDAGLPLERIGFHNDGLLGSKSDYGTYDDESFTREEEMEWLREHLVTGINGGEMPCVNEYSQIERAVDEFPKLKLSYLNLKYNEEVYELWKKQTVNGENAFDYIAKHLGYRFYVSKIKYPERLKDGILGWKRNIEITLVNDGFAPIGSNYALEWVVEDYSGHKYYFDSDAELSKLENNRSIVIKLPISYIKDIPFKRIGIRISDIHDPEKEEVNCVELVNDDFSYEKGVNYLLQADEDMNIDGY